MSTTAAWSTKGTPLVNVAGAVVFSLGVFCIVQAALTLALRGAAWGPSAYACLMLAALLVFVRLRRARQVVRTLHWDLARGGFRIESLPGDVTLTRVWRGPAWLTLGFRLPSSSGRILYLVIWKSAIPAPLWNELVLRAQAGPFSQKGVPFSQKGHQNKENP